MSAKIQHKTLSTTIVDRLRQDILGNVYPPGCQLRQDALASLFGVSRIPVREALIQLEAEGLVLQLPYKGAVVTQLSSEDINDVFDLRGLLEPRLFRRSIPMLTASDFANLRFIEAQFAAAIRSNDLAQWGRLNKDLHEALYAGAHLPQTASVVAGLLQKSDRYTRIQLASDTAKKRAAREHKALIALANDGAIDSACDVLLQHIEAVRRDLLGLLQSG